MSAFVVPRVHVAALIKFARDARIVGPAALSGRAEKLASCAAADILLSDNWRSYCLRYPDESPETEPGFTFAEILAAPVLSPTAAACAAECLDYQCSDAEDWEQRTARALLLLIARAAKAAGAKGRDSREWQSCRAWPVYPPGEGVESALAGRVS